MPTLSGKDCHSLFSETQSDVSILIFQQHTVTRLNTDENCLQSQDNLFFAHQDQRNSCRFFTIHFRINTVTVIKIFDRLVFIIFGDTLNCKFAENVYSMSHTV